MNVVVLIKQVPDTETKIRVTGDKTDIEKSDIKWIINPYDEFAIEEAIKTKERLKEGTVTVITAGPDRTVDALRTALAMGADHAVHVKLEEQTDTLATSKALAEAAKKFSPAIVFTGKQAIDDDQAAGFGYVAEFMDLPSASVVVKAEIAADKKSIKVEREVEGGAKHIIEMPIPCLVAVNKGINSPRYASLPGIMKAKKKEIQVLTAAELGVTADSSGTKDSDYELPPERQAGIKLAGDAATQVKELVKKLREDAKVI